MANEELRIPKRRVTVDFLLAGGTRRVVDVFLGDYAAGHSGGERLSDLLNGPAAFFPAFDADSQAMTIMNRHAIVVARTTQEIEPDAEDEYSAPTLQDVQITLVTGDVLRGCISYVRPAEQSRLPDYLNEPEPFFRMREDAVVSLVNKEQIARLLILKR